MSNLSNEAIVLQKFGYGLFVLTAKDGEKDNGCILDAAMQVALEPNMIILSVSKQNLTHEMIKNTGVFNISFLTEEAPLEIFSHFGFQSGRDVDKFENYDNKRRSENGIYYVTEYTNAYLSGKVVFSRDCGSHTVFFAEVTEAESLSDKPSITYAYYQNNVKPKPEQNGGGGKYVCNICGYVYDEAKGIPDRGIAPGTKFEDLPEDFVCPLCGFKHDVFKKM